MCTRPAAISFAITLGLAIIVGILTASCRHYRAATDSFRLDISLTEFESSAEIENAIRTSLVEKYLHEDMTDSYKVYQLTNGNSRWMFIKAYNAPRGLNMFNFYCYEWKTKDAWLLRSYVPVNVYHYTNSLDRELNIQTDSDYVNVAFRGVVIFTITSKNGSDMTNGAAHKQ